ncbi:hypothetical protein [Oceanicaulis sp.]|uniref:hypothetical protein n=1 Tax=Oceanicaulis sp. TaxID=1924941 RepID=UPI003F7062ED
MGFQSQYPGGGAADVTIGELAIVQAINANSIQYGWKLINQAAALAGSLDRLFGLTVSSGTVDELVASGADFQAVLSDENALVSLSTDPFFRAEVVGSSAAMALIAGSEANLRAVFEAPLLFGSIMADATARGTFTASTELTAATIPNHSTGADTSGVGEIMASSSQSGAAGPSYAVNASTADWWIPDTQPAWLEYEFDDECVIHTAQWNRGTFASNKPETGRFQAFVGGVWVDVVDMPVSGSGNETVYCPAPYSSTRWRINNISTSGSSPLVSDFRLFGFYV